MRRATSCGAVCSIRYNEDLISLWHRNAEDERAIKTVADAMRRALGMPSSLRMEYRKHTENLATMHVFAPSPSDTTACGA